MQGIAPSAAALPLIIKNVYFSDSPGQPWALIDSGTPGMAPRIKAAAVERYGTGSRPEAILLTHGHTDHAGSAAALAELWNTPIYAHLLELPYITGRSPYPPKDPTVGGAMALISRLFPMNMINLSGLVQPLPDDGVVPGLPDWQWLGTPGHSPGHVSFSVPSSRSYWQATHLQLSVSTRSLILSQSASSFPCRRPPLPATGGPPGSRWHCSLL